MPHHSGEQIKSLNQVEIGILGNFIAERPPRQTIVPALRHAEKLLGLEVSARWLSNSELENCTVSNFDALIIAPSGPDEDMANILEAIRYARKHRVPCLGTCGGFQRMATEFALNVLGYPEVQHAERMPDANAPLFVGLSCQIVGVTQSVYLHPNTLVAECYGNAGVFDEVFYCRFGLNPEHIPDFEKAGFHVEGQGADGEARILALTGHPFFIGTLFVSQVSSSVSVPHPLFIGLLQAAVNERKPTIRNDCTTLSHSEMS